MTPFARCSRVFGLAAVVALFVAAMVPTTALAAPGDSESNAVALTLGASTAGTLAASPADPADYLFVYSVALQAGQTVVATCTPSPEIANPDMLAWASFMTDIAGIRSHGIPPAPRVAYLLAPKTGTYYLSIFGQSTPGTFTLDAALTQPISYSLSGMGVHFIRRDSRSRRTYVTVSTTLVGLFDEFNVPVSFVVMRKLNGSWRTYHTYKGMLSSQPDSTHTSFAAGVNMLKGTYRVRARFTDAAHLTPRYNAWKTIVAK